MNAMEISLTGLDVEWRRMEIAALNLANANTTRTVDGGPYAPLRLSSGPAESFGRVLGREQDGNRMEPMGVRIYAVERADDGVRRAYEPGHPDADPSGFVSYPNVSHAGEMTMLMKASRSYEANLVALAAAQQLYSSALQIGRQS